MCVCGIKLIAKTRESAVRTVTTPSHRSTRRKERKKGAQPGFNHRVRTGERTSSVSWARHASKLLCVCGGGSFLSLAPTQQVRPPPRTLYPIRHRARVYGFGIAPQAWPEGKPGARTRRGAPLNGANARARKQAHALELCKGSYDTIKAQTGRLTPTSSPQKLLPNLRTIEPSHPTLPN